MNASFANSMLFDQIISDLECKRITESEAIHLLKTLLDSSEDPRTRLRCIEILGVLNISSDEVFKILESCLLSDEIYSVREAAARALCENFPDRCLAPLKWVIENERTSEVLDIIYKLSDRVHDPLFSALLDKEISELYGVIPQELPFLIDLKILYNERDAAWRWRQEYSLSQFEQYVAPYEHFHYHFGYGSSYPKYTVLNGRIIGVCAPEIKDLPNSIKALSRLKYLVIDSLDSLPCSIITFKRLRGLNLSKQGKLKLPDDIINLKSLRELWLDPSYFNPISKSLISLIEQNIAPKYVKQGVHPEDAVSLGLLEAYFGCGILDYSTLYDVLRELTPNYEINVQGRVITFNLLNGENYWLDGPIPNPIFRFKFLEKLEIFSAGIFSVPHEIKQLKNLRKLFLYGNPITNIPNVLKELKNLEELNLSYTNFREFPEVIFRLPNLKIVNLECTEIPESVANSKIERLKECFEKFWI